MTFGLLELLCTQIYYNAKRADIKRVVLEYRAAIEELLYKAGLKK
jgi:hypothetical protein